MNEELFLFEFTKLVGVNSPVKIDDILKNIDDYDSLTQMTIASWLSNLTKINYTVKDIDELVTVSDIYLLIKE